MTFIEKYEYLFTDLEAFGKSYKAMLPKNATNDEVKNFALNRLNSEIPLIRGNAKEMLKDLNRCNNITDQLS